MQQTMEVKTGQATTDEQAWAIYNQAIGNVCQQAAPTASYSIDRRALRSYSTATSGHNIQEPICFCCARRFPYTTSWGAKQFVKWVCASNHTKAAGVASRAPFAEFLGMPYGEARRILGLQTYIDRYGACGGGGRFCRSRTAPPWIRRLDRRHAARGRCPELVALPCRPAM